jgi:hypothetical protein
MIMKAIKIENGRVTNVVVVSEYAAPSKYGAAWVDQCVGGLCDVIINT